VGNLTFVDCNCMIGTRAHRHPSSPETLQDYLDDFAYYDIQAALVWHAYAQEYSQDYGNRFLLREIGDDPRFIPQWVLVPHWAGEMAPPEELVAEMLALGVRAARVFPKAHGFGTSPEVVGPLLRELATHRVPLFVDVSELDLEAGIGLAKQYPDLPIVLCGVSWASDRIIFARFHEVPNLHLETWAFQGHRHYERFVQAFGSERLLFGTNLPFRSPGAARMMACYEQISDQDRRNTAGGNLLRLLRNVQGANERPVPGLQPAPEHPDDDPIVAAVRAGKPLSEEYVFDAHSHLGHPGCMGVDSCALAYNDANGLVGTLDRCGIDATVCSSWSGITYAAPDANDMTLDAVAKYPGRIYAYGCLNPNYPRMFQEEFDRIFATDRVVGYKPYPPRQACAITDPIHKLPLTWANERGAPVLCHIGSGGPRGVSPEDAAIVAPDYPNAKFLIAHAGSDWDLGERVATAAKQHPNICAEITYTAILYGFIEWFVGEVGPQQLLFGTDCVMRDAAPQMGWVAWARIPLEAKRLVLGHNMADFLKVPGEARRTAVGGG
jgi:predicted TIM-barrel fold metal-dependent hydrolase